MTERQDPGRLRRGLQLVGSTVVLGLLLWQIPARTVVQALGDTPPVAWVLGALLTFASAFLAAWRWQRVLHHLGHDDRFGALLADFLVGTAVTQVLPGALGGDVVRGVRAAQRLPGPAVWSSILFERLMGLLALLAVATAGILALGHPGTEKLLAAALALGLTLGGGLLLLSSGKLVPRMLSYLPWLERHGAVQQFLQLFRGPLSAPRVRLELFAASVVYQLVTLAILLPFGLSWPQADAWAGVFFGVPIALVGATLPVSVGGLGVREGLFALVLAPFGFSAAQAVSLGVVWLLSSLQLSIVGVVLYLRRPR